MKKFKFKNLQEMFDNIPEGEMVEVKLTEPNIRSVFEKKKERAVIPPSK